MDEQTSLTTEESFDDSAFLEGLGVVEEAKETEESSLEGAETAESQTAESQTAETPKAEAKEAPADQPDGMTIKHLGQEVNLKPEQIKEYVQKGYDYDRIRTERDTLKARQTQYDALDQLAKQAGHKDIESFIGELKNTAQNSKLESRIGQLKEAGYYEEQAKYIAKVETERDQAAQAQSAAKAEQERAQAEAQAKQEALNDLFSAYPEVKQFVAYADLPETFRSELEAGKPPLIAWQNHLISEQRAKFEEVNTKLAQYEQNKKNAESAAPSAKGAKTIEKDPFLEGLFGQ